MRLAIVRRRLASAGGAERFIQDAARDFSRFGIEVTLISEGTDGSASMPAERWLRVPTSKGGRAGRYARFQAEVESVLAASSFDLVQTHERVVGCDVFRAGDGVHAAWVDRLKRSRSFLRRPLLALDSYHRLLMETERSMVRESDVIFVANSRLVMDELEQWLNVPASRIRQIENGVDLKKFEPADADQTADARQRFGLEPDDRVVVFVGSGFERKGAFHLARALAMNSLREVKCLVVGRDKRLKGLQSLVATLGIDARVKLLGALDDVRPALHAADLLALPTLYDPMPNAALEAIACGLPVVTTADAGIARHIVEVGAGEISTRDPESIAAAIEAVLEGVEDRRAQALALRSRFDLKEKTEEWMSLYRELV